jgi:hypothetical protein
MTRKLRRLGRISYDVITDHGEETYSATIKSVEFHATLGPIFTAITPYGNIIRLTEKEINRRRY